MPARQRGAATVWVLAAGILVIGVASVVALAGAAMVARHRAQAAADLGALAAATQVRSGPEAACAWAGEMVAANGGRMLDCHWDGLDVLIDAEVCPPPVAAIAGCARATSRAGPA